MSNRGGYKGTRGGTRDAENNVHLEVEGVTTTSINSMETISITPPKGPTDRSTEESLPKSLMNMQKFQHGETKSSYSVPEVRSSVERCDQHNKVPNKAKKR